MNLVIAKGATLLNSLWVAREENSKLKRPALKVRLTASLRCAFSARSQFNFYPGALPQVKDDFALSALNE